MRRHAWVDASAGIAGDMLLGALLDAGASLTAVQSAVDAVSGGTVQVRCREVIRGGLRALKADVEPLVADPPHRAWADVRELLEQAGTDTRTAEAVFRCLAEAEARVHGVKPDDVHFHEVGALDAIADVVGCCAALADLGVGTVSAGPVALGSGTVRTRHGRLPVPAPAVAELAKGWRVSAGGAVELARGWQGNAGAEGELAKGGQGNAGGEAELAKGGQGNMGGEGGLAKSGQGNTGGEGELATPTGMALLRTLAHACEPLPPMALEAVGVGAGTRDPAGHANVVRVMIGLPESHAPVPGVEPAQASDRGQPGGRAVLLEANVDDLDPRLWPGILHSLLRNGAQDAWLVPIVMKKGRPAHTLSVLCAPALADTLRDLIFRDTSTLGVRHSSRGKVALERAFADVTVGDTRIAVKVAHRGGVVVQVMPEFDDVAALARRQQRPERLVLQEALAAAGVAGLIVGAALPENLRAAQ